MMLRSIAVAAVLAVTTAGVAAAEPSSAHATTVKVKAMDFSFKLSTKVVKAGRVTFMIRNDGQTEHDFAIAGHRSKLIGPGKTTTLTVTLKRGRYPYKCTFDSHARLGMKGVLRVT